MMGDRINCGWNAFAWSLVAATLVSSATPASLAAGALPASWMPAWQVGDWWLVESRYLGQTFEIEPDPTNNPNGQFVYRVIRSETLAGQDCFVVSQTFFENSEDTLNEPPPRSSRACYALLYFRKHGLRLVRSTYWKPTPYGLKSHPHDTIAYAGTPRVVALWPGSSFMMFPVFPLDSPVPNLQQRPVELQEHSQSWALDQMVVTARLDSFAGAREQFGSSLIQQLDCYDVRLQVWDLTSPPRSPTWEEHQAWLPGLPWFLSSYGKALDPQFEPREFLRKTLLDCSAWHEKGK